MPDENGKVNVLYLSHVEGDFGGGFLYDGLCQLIGERHVFDCPSKLSYHGKVHHYHLADRPDPGVTGPLGWIPAYENAWMRERGSIGDNLDDETLFVTSTRLLAEGFFDLVVVESCRPLAVAAYHKLRESIVSANVPVVVHDGEDMFHMYDDIISSMSPKLILKREFRPEWGSEKIFGGGIPIIPFPFSFPYRYRKRGNEDSMFDTMRDLPRVKASERIYDVIQMMGRTWQLRQEIANAIRQQKDFKWYVALNPDDQESQHPIMTLLAWEKYMQHMGKGKMAVSCRGFGWDTCHYWETAYATVMLCDVSGIVIPNDFQHDQTCIKYNNPNDCVAKIKAYLANPAKLEEIRTAGRDHVLKYHTTRERVRIIFERLGIEV